MKKITLNVGGMHCGSCAMAVELVLKDKPGVKSAKVDYDAKKAEVEFDEAQVKVDDLKKEITKIGFTASE